MKLPEQVILELKKIHAPQYSVYEKVLNHAFDSNIPVFAQDKFSRRYSDMANDPEWFANSLVANSCLEGYGSQQIWKFSNLLDNEAYAAKVRKHALDESRHSTMFISALKLVFPGVLDNLDSETLKKIKEMQPFFSEIKHPPIEKASPEDRYFEIESIDELIQVHITEIRALVLQYMVREAFIKHAPEENLPRLIKISDRLITDEAKHINYSAEIFNHYASNEKNQEFFFEVFEKRLKDFNDLTKKELEEEAIEL